MEAVRYSEEALPFTEWASIVLQSNNTAWPCYADRGSQSYRYTATVGEVGATYQLDLPSLSLMKPGQYSGSVSYRVGDGGDIDLGRSITIDDEKLDISVELLVARDIQIDFPPGSDRAVLQPAGGWNAWSGGKPAKQLTRDIPFRISIDGPVGVYLNCEYTVAADRCGLRNERGQEVPLATRLTLRSATVGGSSAVKVTLPTAAHDKRVFTPPQVLRNQPGTLHFSVEGEDVKSMVENPGSTYQGQVTVVFDAWI